MGYPIPGVAAVWLWLKELHSDCDWPYIAAHSDEPSIDVRLNVQKGSWELLSGDPCYDTDHRGHWGSAMIGQDDTPESLLATATDLIDQVRDDIAISGEDESGGDL